MQLTINNGKRVEPDGGEEGEEWKPLNLLKNICQ